MNTLDDTIRAVEEFMNTEGPSEAEPRRSTVGGRDQEVQSDPPPSGPTKHDHEAYMFGTLHAFVD